jgi:hypothetical protein
LTPPDDALVLQREFRATPIGAHSPALARILSHMRAMPIGGKLCILCQRPYEAYAIGRMSVNRGEPPKLLDNRVFKTPSEAEWEIFKLRWLALFGHPIDEDAL